MAKGKTSLGKAMHKNLTFAKTTLLHRVFNNKAIQRIFFVGSVAIGAASILSGAWMVAKGDLFSAAGMVGSVFPLVIGCIGLHRLSKLSPRLNY